MVHRTDAAAALAAALLIALGAGTARADTLVWSNAGGGPAGVAGNWSPQQTPAASDVLVFDLGGSYAVSFGATVPSLGEMNVDDGQVDFDFVSTLNTIEGDLRIGLEPGFTPSLSIRSGSPTFLGRAFVGYGAGGFGFLTIEDATPVWAGNLGSVTVGSNDGYGVLDIRDGAEVHLVYPLHAGANGGEGSVTVRGAGLTSPFTRTALTIEDRLHPVTVGSGGDGTLAVDSGAIADIEAAVLVGGKVGGDGTIRVEGLSGDLSELFVRNDLWLGAGYPIDPEPGGRGEIVVGDDGAATVDGGTWTFDPDGGEGGTIEVLEGGTFTSHALHVKTSDDLLFRGGEIVVAGGVLDVDDTNGPFEVEPDLSALEPAGETTARLTLEGGASAAIGSSASAGPALRVGKAGDARLTLRDAELVVHDFNAVVGDEPGSSGIIEVTEGGRLTVDEHLILGREGYGALNVLAGSEAWIAGDLRSSTRQGATGGVIIEAGGTVHVGGRLSVAGTPTAPADALGAGLVFGTLALDADGPAGVLWPGSELVLLGGHLQLAGTLGIEGGLLRLDGGSTSGGRIELAPGGRLEASGSVASSVVSVPGSSITATGDLALGGSAPPATVSLGGDLLVGTHPVSVVSSDSIRLGDVELGGGSLFLSASYGSRLPAGRSIVGHGTVTGSLVVQGAMEAGGAPARGGGAEEIAVSGFLVGTGEGMRGTRFRFLGGASFHASGLVEAGVAVDENAAIHAMGALTMGDPTGAYGISIDGRLLVNGEEIVLTPPAPVRIGGELVVGGGRASSTRPIQIGESGRLSGTGAVAASVEAAGTVAPEPVDYAPNAPFGRLRIEKLVMAPTARLDAELGEQAAGAWDSLFVDGRAALAGTLELTTLPGFSDVPGDSFLVVLAGEIAGTFDEVVLDGVPASPRVDVIYGARTVHVVTTGTTTPVEEVPGEPVAVPPVTSLAQNAPNPFNPTTSITYALSREGAVRLRVFDANGRLVRRLADGVRPAAEHRVTWDGRDDAGRSVASGVYLYRLDAPGFSETRRMVLMK